MTKDVTEVRQKPGGILLGEGRVPVTRSIRRRLARKGAAGPAATSSYFELSRRAFLRRCLLSSKSSKAADWIRCIEESGVGSGAARSEPEEEGRFE